MKPPLTYYGGKQMMLKHILPLIPPHNLYCEPFFGGGAVFFAKEPSNIEVINDTNGELMNFYDVVSNYFNKLDKKIKSTLHSREIHQDAKMILSYPKLFSKIDRAWAIWVMANESYGSKLNGTWTYDRKENRTAKRLAYKRKEFSKLYAERLENAEIESADAIQVIKSRDSHENFFYIDPPYFNSHQGHYQGYTKKDFLNLLEVLASLKGKFLLSSYPSEILATYVNKYGWHVKEIKKTIFIGKSVHDARKREVLTANYDLI